MNKAGSLACHGSKLLSTAHGGVALGRQTHSVVTPVPTTAVLGPTHTGPKPAKVSKTLVLVKRQPLQSFLSVIVVPAAVMVQPNGTVEIEVVVQRQLVGNAAVLNEGDGGELEMDTGVCVIEVSGSDMICVIFNVVELATDNVRGRHAVTVVVSSTVDTGIGQACCCQYRCGCHVLVENLLYRSVVQRPWIEHSLCIRHGSYSYRG